MVMPQLDFSTFPSQIFWVVVLFAGFYFCISLFILPKINNAFMARKFFIESIDKKTNEFESQLRIQKTKYQNAIDDAASVAEDIMHDVQIWMKKYQEDQNFIFSQKVNLLTEKNNKDILIFRENSRASFEDLVFFIVMLYTNKVLGKDYVIDEKYVSFIKKILNQVVENRY